MKFGDKLRKLREAKGISPIIFAKKLGVAVPYLRDIELNYRMPPSNRLIKKIARLLDCDADEPFKLSANAQPLRSEVRALIRERWPHLTQEHLLAIKAILMERTTP